MVLVIVRAFQLHVFAVKEKSLVGVETDRADAKRRFVTIHHCTVGCDRRNELVKVRRINGPELWMGNGQELAELSTRADGEGLSFGFLGGDVLAGFVENRLLNLERGGIRALIENGNARRESRRVLLQFRGDERAVPLDVQWRGLHQPHMAVNSRALVKPAFLQRRVHANDYDILATVVEKLK